MSRCRSCGADIFFATTVNGKPQPIDARPTAEGNLELENRDGRLFVTVVGPLERLLAEGERPLYLAHHASCPFAGDHRPKAVV